MLNWLVVVGLGMIWLGAQIIWVAPTPSVLRRPRPAKPDDPVRAFGVFWLDQYAWIGIVLSLLGGALLVGGVVRA